MIGWTPIRELYSHLREVNPEFNSHAVTGQILSAFFKGEENVFPHPDTGSESKSPFRIANWETIGATSPELKTFLGTHRETTNQHLNEYENKNYRHYNYYHQNRSSLFSRFKSRKITADKATFLSEPPEWDIVAEKFSSVTFPMEITTYFIDTIEIRNSTAYAAINYFGLPIPCTWIESFCIDLEKIGKPGPKPDQARVIPGIWLQPLIEDGWHTPTLKGLQTAAMLIHHLFCPELKPDSIRKIIKHDYKDALAKQDRKITLHTNTTI